MATIFVPSPEMLDCVAEWRQRQTSDQLRRPIIPLLRERFSVSNAEAISIVRHAAQDEAETVRERFISAIKGEGGADASQ